ncbi:unnamed protein product [Somion occarium]|uniref:CASTOR ACT domain-containing protein n=1 Tax=Somion occarium TaxID=3059160 RepID=A0ABP1D021_9APHY
MTDSVTISLLPVSLSIVHVPRSRIHSLCHPLLRQLLLPNPMFLNITCNEIELSLFAEHHVLKEFEPIVKKDARRLRLRGRTNHASDDKLKRRSSTEGWEAVEMSAERWNVLQIDSHSSSLDTSGARIHELSAPLAAAGISILYQSSYMSDFIFVKQHRLSEVMSLLGSAGFNLYSSDPHNLTSQLSTLTSPILSPLSAEDSSSIHLLDLTSSTTSTSAISPESGAVLSRSRSSTDAKQPSRRPSSMHLTEEALREAESTLDTSENTLDIERPLTARSQSHSPSGCDVQVLEPDLTCIGLADDCADMWTLKIMKLVAFPDLIPGVAASSTLKSRRHSVASGKPDLAPTDVPARSAVEDESEEISVGLTSDSETESGGSRSDTTTRDLPYEDADREFSAEDADSSDDESYHSASLGSPAQTYPDDKGTHISRPRLAHLDTGSTVTSPRRRRRAASEADSAARSKPDPLVPFFSFTRTPEGSSLTGSVALLAALFPPSERHMVICSGELDIQDSRAASPQRLMEPLETIAEDGLEVGEGDLPEPEGTMKCLQIDLRKFGLDKHGLVSRYSRALEQNGINHMYSSTFKTANLLVDKAHATRAQAVLRSC